MISFYSRARVPYGLPEAAYPVLVPDLVVEVLSRTNTSKEMDRKRREYFSAGVRLGWFVDIERRNVVDYVSPQDPIVLKSGDSVEDGDVSPVPHCRRGRCLPN